MAETGPGRDGVPPRTSESSRPRITPGRDLNIRTQMPKHHFGCCAAKEPSRSLRLGQRCGVALRGFGERRHGSGAGRAANSQAGRSRVLPS